MVDMNTVELINAPASVRAKWPTKFVRTCHSRTCNCFSHESGYWLTTAPAAVAARLSRIPGNAYEHACHVWKSARTPSNWWRGASVAASVQRFLEETPFLSEVERGVFVSTCVDQRDLTVLDTGRALSQYREFKAIEEARRARKQYSNGFCNPMAAALAKAGI